MSYTPFRTCRKCSLALIFLLLYQVVTAQYHFGELDQYLQSNQKKLGPDALAMIWKDDTLIYEKVLGDFNKRTKAPIASASKWLTAALVMTFIDEGKLSLDDKVSQYIPEFARQGKNYITIRHCISHMTGIQSEPVRVLKLLERKKYNSLEEEVHAFANKPIQTNPGTEFRYSNIGLNIAGRVLEVISKRKFDMLIRQRLLTPLGMRSTSFSTIDGSAVNPSGGAVSTPDDYMKFLVMLLNKGKVGDKQILSEASVNEMRQVHTSPALIGYAPASAQDFNYASGSWVLRQNDNQAEVLASPGLFGTWPLVDYCNGYAYLFFVKNFLGEERAETQMNAVDIINKSFNSDCK